MTPPPYSRPLPGPLAAARRRLLLAAWLGRPSPATIEVDGFSLMFEAGLPDPRPSMGFSAAAFLLEAMQVRPGERTLVLECGAGWVSLAAMRGGARVVSMDPNPNALQCVRRSSLVAGFGEPDVRTGDGLAPLGVDETFDLVAWMPPLLDGPSGSGRSDRHVVGDRARITNVLKGIHPRLERGGRVLFPFPDRDATPWLHDALRNIGYRFAAVRYSQAPLLGPVRVYKAWPAGQSRPGEVAAGEALSGASWVLRDR